MSICPNLDFAFQILGKKWNGFILHHLYTQPDYSSSFTEIKAGVTNITPRALSSCLQDLCDRKLINKKADLLPQFVVSYELTESGIKLVEALRPVQQWAYDYSLQMDKDYWID